MTNKAQATIQYLLIVGAIMISAIIVVTTMGGIPNLSVRGTEKTNYEYWKSLPVGVVDFAIDQDGDYIFSIKNNLRTSIIFENLGISLPGEEGGYLNNSLLIQPGQNILVYHTKGEHGKIPNGETCIAGYYYSYKLSITYKERSTPNALSIRETGNDGKIALKGTCAISLPKKYKSDEGHGHGHED